MNIYLNSLKETFKKETFSFITIFISIYIICIDSYKGSLGDIHILFACFIIIDSYFIQQTLKGCLKNDSQ